MRKLAAITLGVALALGGTAALASRNSSGTYSLPAGNPVVGGTTITKTWANTTLGDIGQSLTDSLDRNGKGGMLAPLRVPDGSAPAPTLSFTNETGTGLRRAGAGDLRIGVTGTDVLKLTASTVSVPAGDLHLTKAGSVQRVFKEGAGSLVLQAEVDEVQFWTGNVLAAAVQASGVLDMAGHKIATVADPTNAQDAATKGYVDGLVVGSPVVSSSSGNFTTTSTSPTYVDVTNLSATITTRGRPVMLLVQPAGATGSTMANTTTTATLDIVIVRGATNIARWFLGAPYATAPQLQFLDVVAAGTYTYKVQAAVISGGTGYVTQYKLIAIEL
jgi:hypothetical protein